MKNFKVLLIPGAIGVMCLALFAQEPQGRGGQGAAPGSTVGAGVQVPQGDGAPAAGGGQRGGRGGGPPQAGGPPRGGGGGGKNVQVLGNADLPATMQRFVQALGLLVADQGKDDSADLL